MAHSMLKKLAWLGLVCMVLRTLTVPHAAEAAVTCGAVTKSLAPCMSYLKGTGKSPPGPCCAGVRSLKTMAQTTADRRTACNCMKTAAARMKGLNYAAASRLPSQCGVSIAYTFSPRTNCNNVK